jgi:hypothetical protein
VGEPNLVALPDHSGRADRYYGSAEGLVAVEVTRLVDPDKERGEADPKKFLLRDVAPLLEGNLPARYFASISPPWTIPPVGSNERKRLAASVATEIAIAAPHVQAAGALADVSVEPDIRLHLIRASVDDGRREVVYGGMGSLYGGWEGELRREAAIAIASAISLKASKRQTEGRDISRRVLLLHDLMGGAEPDVLDSVVAALPAVDRNAFDEVAVVAMFDNAACHRVTLP